MPLFQHSIIKKYLGELDQALLDAAWERFQKHFHNAVTQQIFVMQRKKSTRKAL